MPGAGRQRNAASPLQPLPALSGHAAAVPWSACRARTGTGSSSGAPPTSTAPTTSSRSRRSCRWAERCSTWQSSSAGGRRGAAALVGCATDAKDVPGPAAVRAAFARMPALRQTAPGEARRRCPGLHPASLPARPACLQRLWPGSAARGRQARGHSAGGQHGPGVAHVCAEDQRQGGWVRAWVCACMLAINRRKQHPGPHLLRPFQTAAGPAHPPAPSLSPHPPTACLPACRSPLLPTSCGT